MLYKDKSSYLGSPFSGSSVGLWLYQTFPEALPCTLGFCSSVGPDHS